METEAGSPLLLTPLHMQEGCLFPPSIITIIWSRIAVDSPYRQSSILKVFKFFFCAGVYLPFRPQVLKQISVDQAAVRIMSTRCNILPVFFFICVFCVLSACVCNFFGVFSGANTAR